MPRAKSYNEERVIEKALMLFWRNGFKNTSARMLEKTMKINLFSIYSSFGSKNGVFLGCLRAYKGLNRNKLLNPLKECREVDGIRNYFQEFLKFTKEKDCYRGCLMINAAHEMGSKLKPKQRAEIEEFSKEIMNAFISILSNDPKKPRQTVIKQANYLFVSLQGLITSAKTLNEKQINDYIELTFLHI